MVCTFAYITLYSQGAAGNRMLLYMQHAAQHYVVKLVEHAPIAKE